MPKQKRLARRQARLAMVDKYLTSSQPQKQFCQNEQIHYTTFQYWLKKYRQQQRQAGCVESSAKQFVPLRFSSADRPQPVPCYTLEYPSGVVLHITVAIDAPALIQLIRAQDI